MKKAVKHSLCLVWLFGDLIHKGINPWIYENWINITVAIVIIKGPNTRNIFCFQSEVWFEHKITQNIYQFRMNTITRKDEKIWFQLDSCWMESIWLGKNQTHITVEKCVLCRLLMPTNHQFNILFFIVVFQIMIIKYSLWLSIALLSS